MGLTKPQLALLRDIAQQSQAISPSYAPAKALVSHGFAEWVPHRFSDHLTITTTGRSALETQDQPHDQ